MESLHWVVGAAHKLGRFVDPLGPFAFFYANGSWVIWPIVSFVVIGLSMYALSIWQTGQCSIRDAFQYVFPREFYKNPSTRIDIWNYVLTNMFIAKPFAFLFALFWSGQQVRAFLIDHYGPAAVTVGTGRLTGVCEALVVVLVFDLCFYSAHYACHRVPFLWRIHAAHHSAEVLTPFSGIRAHPTEFILFNLPGAIATALASGVMLYFTGPQFAHGAGPLLFAKFLYDQVVTLLQHSHLRLSYGKLGYILCSPIMHQMHHSAETRHRDVNLGSFSSVYDWMFGTLYLPKGREEFRLGKNLEETGERNPHRTLTQFYVEPIVSAYRTLTERRELIR